MAIVSGYNKYKRYILTDSGYKLVSQWTSANTVVMDDGTTLQSTITSLNSTLNNKASKSEAIKSISRNGTTFTATRTDNTTFTFTQQDNNTTYSAGSNITLSGTTFSLTKANVVNALGYTPPTSDTNTWRGIQNNLTSTSTTDSLSANQGRILNINKQDVITARCGWGKSVTCTGGHGLLIVNTDLYIVWLASTNSINVTSVGHWYSQSKESTFTFNYDSPSSSGVTLRRSGNSFTCTTTGNSTISWIGW